jgi:hypothetical protein
MARCEGTTRSGEQCKREAREGSKFCYVHEPDEEEGTADEAEALEFDDFVPLILAGLMTAGFFVLFKSLGRWMPRF